MFCFLVKIKCFTFCDFRCEWCQGRLRALPDGLRVQTNGLGYSIDDRHCCNNFCFDYIYSKAAGAAPRGNVAEQKRETERG